MKIPENISASMVSNLASVHLWDNTSLCDVVFYVLRTLPLIVDKLYYEASVVALNCDILRVKLIVGGRV